MEFNEIDVLKSQIAVLLERIKQLESDNSKHYAMLTVIAKDAEAKDKAASEAEKEE